MDMKNGFVTLALWVFYSASSFSESLRILNWDEYLSPAVVERWERETGIHIEQIYFDDDEKRDAILANSRTLNIDIAVIDETVSKLFGQGGKLIAVDEINVPNIKNIEPSWRSRCDRYAVPYLWGTLGIAYRSDRVERAPTSWIDILQPAESLKGHVGMIDDHMDMLAPALFSLGYPLNTSDESQLKAAFDILKRQAPSVLTYEYGITFLESSELRNELYMVEVYSGDQQALNEITGRDVWRYVVPEEGTVLWVDCLAVLNDSNKKTVALQFINFLNRPDIAALNSENLHVASPNAAARKLMSPEFLNNTEVFISKASQDKSEVYSVLDMQNQRLRKRITQAIRTFHDSE